MNPSRKSILSAPDSTNNEPIRISKLLAQRGIASRSEADRMIEKGWVAVNGFVAIPGDRAALDAEITLSAEAHAQLDDALTVIMNKPRGFTSAADEFGGAPAMTLLTPQNFFTTTPCAPDAPDGLQPPRLPGSGLRVAGRLSTREMGLVVFTTDTALARRLAAVDVEETWCIDFRATPPDDAIEIISSALHNAVQVANDPDNANALLLTTPSLAKGILSSICDGQSWRTDLTRIRRGEIALGDVPTGRWRML
ncbi:MAG: S4 domain-containing protein [Casimicrobium sp.]